MQRDCVQQDPKHQNKSFRISGYFGMRSLIWFKIQSCRKLTQTSMESCGEVTLNSMLTKEGSMELRQNIMLSCGIPWKSGYVSTIPIKCQIISSKSHFLYPTWASMEIRWSAGSAVLCDSFQEQRRNVQSQQLRSDLWQSEVRHWVLLRSKNIHIHLIDMQPICISHIYIYVYTCIYIYAYHIICIYEHTSWNICLGGSWVGHSIWIFTSYGCNPTKSHLLIH